ncbi:MAG: ATP-binding cassette domain-containing protein [Spirochaetaceae bacterium]|nr:ATP-binding cassette domain-containing protein [Spirochaetaceae bacterium]
MSNSIIIKDISLSFGDKFCFIGFNAQIPPGSRIAIMGNNGSGKSCLLKMISGRLEPSSGQIFHNDSSNIGYVPQIISANNNLSGAENFNKALSLALANNPDILLLDEPTNHLDGKNRASLFKMLKHYKGALIIISHDEELLQTIPQTLWYINNGKIDIFNGKYNDYQATIAQNKQSTLNEAKQLKRDKKESHLKLMKEQERAQKSREHGKKMVAQKRWLPAVGDAKAGNAGKTAGKKLNDITSHKEALKERLTGLPSLKVIKPTFPYQ